VEQSKEIGVTTFVPVQDRDERTFLRELTHRIQKKFISSINVVSAAAVRTESSEVKVALSHVGRRVAMRSCNTRRVLSVCDTSSAGMMRRWSGSGPELLFQRGGVRPLRPGNSDIDLFRSCKRVVDFNAKVPNNAFDCV
jgi:hypothetical protein